VEVFSNAIFFLIIEIYVYVCTNYISKTQKKTLNKITLYIYIEDICIYIYYLLNIKYDIVKQ